MQVSLDVDWQQQPIQLTNSQPVVQTGVVIQQSDDYYKGTYQFEGKLHPHLIFEAAK
jgi:hypothetical protein